jgi:hypothetical protein
VQDHPVFKAGHDIAGGGHVDQDWIRAHQPLEGIVIGSVDLLIHRFFFVE